MEDRLSKVEQKLTDHIAWDKEARKRNDDAHEEIMTKLDAAMIFQSRLRWVIGISSTMLGIIFMIIYNYLPWIWDALPKHGHTH